MSTKNIYRPSNIILVTIMTESARKTNFGMVELISAGALSLAHQNLCRFHLDSIDHRQGKRQLVMSMARFR